MSQYQENATVTDVEELSDTNYRVTLDSPLISKEARPGQFAMIRVGSGKDPLLRRPFSVHQTGDNGKLQFYFKVVGRGTEMLACVRAGEELSVFGPLGKGFSVKKDKAAVIIGGGLGIAPLLLLLKENCRVKQDCSHDLVILGGRSKEEVGPLLADFEEYGVKVLTTTDDGTLGHKGFVTDLLRSEILPSQAQVYACGPEPMLAGISAICREKSLKCQVSIESVMACGMGACLGCSRPAKGGEYTHVCVNGPVYDAEKLEWNI